MPEYQLRPPRVLAERFDVSVKPWPPGVLPWTNPMASYTQYIMGPRGKMIPLNDGDWIVTHPESGDRSILDDAEFSARYEPVWCAPPEAPADESVPELAAVEEFDPAI